MPLITEERLRDICWQIILAMQAPPDVAETVADILVTSDVKGVDSHGCRLLSMYLRNMQIGAIIPSARPQIICQEGALTQIEGNWAFGHPVARQAARTAAENARQFGVGVASVVHVLHIGRIGEYAEEIARQGMFGLVVCNAGRAVSPYGGLQRMFGTNPIAMAAPRGDGKLLLSDFATSSKSVNKLHILRQRGEPVPEGMILDKDGYPSTDANDFFAGGYLLPIGGYKGFGLNLFIDILGGVLVGAKPAIMLDKHPGNGTLMIALDIARWRPLEEFSAELETLLGLVKDAPVQPGFEEILLPGELEERTEADRRRLGIPLDEEIWTELHDVAAAVGLSESIFDPEKPGITITTAEEA